MEKPLSPPPFTADFRTENPALVEWLRDIPNRIPRVTNYSISLDVASVAASTISRQSFTVEGIDAGDSIFINCPSISVGLEMLAGYRVTAANTIEIPFWNYTGSPINQVAVTFKVWAFR